MFCGCRSHIYAFMRFCLTKQISYNNKKKENKKKVAITFYEFFKNDPPTVDIVEEVKKKTFLNC